MISETANPEQTEAVLDFYHDLMESMKGRKHSPAWTRDVYPDDELLRDLVRSGNFHLLFRDGRIAAAVVLNQISPDGYDTVPWKVSASQDECLYVHLLAVSPDFQRQGLAGRLIADAGEKARKLGCKAIRLDVMENNIPAMRTYESLGFDYVGKQKIYYEDTGWKDFHLYELEI